MLRNPNIGGEKWHATYVNCPFDGVNYVFQNFLYIFDCCNFKIIGNNGPFPLLYLFIVLVNNICFVYESNSARVLVGCKPITFDLIECIYCLNDLFKKNYNGRIS